MARNFVTSAFCLRLRMFVAAIVLILASAHLLGCASSFDKRGVYYTVRSGESIWRIARIFRTDVQSLAEYNNVMDPSQIHAGMKVYIPPRRGSGFKILPFGQSVSASEPAAAQAAGKKPKRSEDRYSKPIQVYRGRFIWPVNGKVVSLFGFRDGRRHDGLDISAPDGTPIHAAAAGKVVFAGSMRGYGNLILLRHQDDMFTAYSHNSRNKVEKGQVVKQGQVIGLVGRTGRATGSHLHFEIRNGQTARNPLFFLPERKDGVVVAPEPERKEKGVSSPRTLRQQALPEDQESDTLPLETSDQATDEASPAGAPEEGTSFEENVKSEEKKPAPQVVPAAKSSSTPAAGSKKQGVKEQPGKKSKPTSGGKSIPPSNRKTTSTSKHVTTPAKTKSSSKTATKQSSATGGTHGRTDQKTHSGREGLSKTGNRVQGHHATPPTTGGVQRSDRGVRKPVPTTGN